MNLREPSANHRWLNIPTPTLALYNTSHDARHTASLRIAAERLLREVGNWDFYQRWFTHFIPSVMSMQRRGFGHLDRGRRFDIYKRLRHEMREVEHEALACTGMFGELVAAEHAFAAAFDTETQHEVEKRQAEARTWAAESARRNPDARLRKVDEWAAKRPAARERKLNSMKRGRLLRRARFFNMSKDLKNVAFDELGLKPAPKTRDRAERSLEQGSLLYILSHMRKCDEPATPFLHALCHRSRIRTITQRYMRFWVDGDDRVYPTINCASARTMRLAYSEPSLQQWPAEIRSMIVAKPGHVFVSFDYSQIEARIFAYEANDRLMLEGFAAFDAIEDKKSLEALRVEVHAANARQRGNMTWEQWQALPGEVRAKHRTGAKRFLYRLLYGGSDDSEKIETFCPCVRCVEKVPQTLDQPARERILAQQRWLAAHPAVQTWQDSWPNACHWRGDRYTSRFGYTHHFNDPWPSSRTQMLNHPMQHGASQVIGRAMEQLTAYGREVPLVLQMHDNLIAEVPEGGADMTYAYMKGCMEQPIPEYGGMVFPVEGKCGYDWGQV